MEMDDDEAESRAFSWRVNLSRCADGARGRSTVQDPHMILLAFALAAAQPFTCTIAAVHDGDTMRCDDGTRIRLQGIDANEMDGSCHIACAPLGAAQARDSLARLALRHEVHCTPIGRSYNRITAWCSVRMNLAIRRDLSCAQVTAGAAIRWAKFDPDGRLLACKR